MRCGLQSVVPKLAKLALLAALLLLSGAARAVDPAISEYVYPNGAKLRIIHGETGREVQYQGPGKTKFIVLSSPSGEPLKILYGTKPDTITGSPSHDFRHFPTWESKDNAGLIGLQTFNASENQAMLFIDQNGKSYSVPIKSGTKWSHQVLQSQTESYLIYSLETYEAADGKMNSHRTETALIRASDGKRVMLNHEFIPFNPGEVTIENGKVLIKGEAKFGSVLDIVTSARPMELGNETQGPPLVAGKNAETLADPAVREHLRTLNGRLSQRVIGQPVAAQSVTTGLTQRITNGAVEKPAAFLFLGSTGTGKTELAKAIAIEHYGDPKAFISFNLGELKEPHELSRIFGSPPGYDGAKEVLAFEQFLIDHPNGGVINFDEIGNMGKDKATRDAMLKAWYQMLDDGYWRSPNNIKYDVSKFTLTFSSNEGQEIFENLPTDDLRIAEWKAHNHPDQLAERLKKMGWPEALVARFLSNLTLFKPLIEAERMEVAKIMLDNTIKNLTQQHGIKIAYDDSFLKTVAETFFSHSSGARKMIVPTSDELSGILTGALLDLYENPADLKNATATLSLSDNFAGLFMNRKGKPLERKVPLSVHVNVPGKAAKSYAVDLASKAVQRELGPSSEALRTAIHEAAHSVANNPQKTGQAVDFITVRGAGNFNGYVRFNRISGAAQGMTRDRAVATIAQMLAGGIAEQMEFPSTGPSSGWSQDLRNTRTLAEHLVADYGGTDLALRLPFREGKVIVEHPAVQEEMIQLIADGEAYARRLLMRRWPAVRQVAADLLRKGHIDGMEFQTAVRKAAQVAQTAHRLPASFYGRSLRENDCSAIYSTLFEGFSE